MGIRDMRTSWLIGIVGAGYVLIGAQRMLHWWGFWQPCLPGPGGVSTDVAACNEASSVATLADGYLTLAAFFVALLLAGISWRPGRKALLVVATACALFSGALVDPGYFWLDLVTSDTEDGVGLLGGAWIVLAGVLLIAAACVPLRKRENPRRAGGFRWCAILGSNQ